MLLGQKADIIAYRAGSNELTPPSPPDEALDIRSYRSLDDALKQRPVAAFICNPTSMHVPVAKAAALAGCHIFVEKPISHNTEGLHELQRLVHARDLKTLVGFQFRHHPGLVIARDLIQRGSIGRVTHAAASWGEYLPGWHPGEDYHRGYSARSDLGGGAILTLSHPFDYLRWMLGEVRAVTAVAGQNGSLGIDVEDTADVLLEFHCNAIATVHLNYIQRPPSHRLELVGTSGTITWDNETGCVRWFQANTGEWRNFPAPVGFERNSMFLAELRHFLDCISGKAEPAIPLEDGVKTLAVTLGAKRSVAEGRKVEIAS